MGFFEKVKNMFTEEVEEEVKVEKVKKEPKKVVSENLTNKEVEESVDKLEDDLFAPNEDLNFNKPVFFDDNDFQDLNFSSSRSRMKKDDIPTKSESEKSKGIYSLKGEPDEKKIFKPTPIISPVYGVLDKNYHKEDIVSRNESKDSGDYYEPTVDTIRNKAYGTLEDELENTLFGQNSILLKDDKEVSDDSVNVNDDMLSSLTDDISKELDELLVKKEKYTDEEIKKNIKEDDSLDEEDLLGFIDSTLYKDGEAE